MTHGQLFAGIGGFGLPAQWAGIENVWANEIDSFCCKVLRKNFKGLQIYEQDIREIGKHNLESVDIISGGFPCQPFSHAGKRKGKEDDRYLWPEMLRVIQEVKPSWVIGENVAGLKSMEYGKTLERILIDLEDVGYQVETFLIPASAVGAWHRRNRIWIIAFNSNAINSRSYKKGMHINGNVKLRNEQKCNTKSICRDVPDTANAGIKRVHQRKDSATKKQWNIEPNVGRVANGIPSRVDRLKGLGNAIVPQVAYEIFKAIVNGI